jgi:hypothetical protein
MTVFTAIAESRPDVTQLTGHMVKAPTYVSSPVYAQIVSVSVVAGDTVQQGEQLATLLMLDPANARIPNDSLLYQTLGQNEIAVKSPVDGIVGEVIAGEESTIQAGSNLITIYTPASTQLRVLLPRGTTPDQYTHYYATAQMEGQHYPIRLVFPIPNTSQDPALSTYSIYAAQFMSPQAADALLPYHDVIVLAERPARLHKWLPLPTIHLPRL